MIRWAIGIAVIVLAVGVWYVDGADFWRAHARRRTYLLDAARLGTAAAAFLIVDVPLGLQPSPLAIATTVFGGVLVYIPTRWVLRIGEQAR
jgi:hypothetical protein